MMKRFLAALLALTMVLAMVPLAVQAEPAAVTKSPKAGTHTGDGHSDDCGKTTGWTAWTSTTSLPTSGQYYLTADVTLTNEVQVSGDLTICLNGYVITTTAAKRLLSTKDGAGVTFTITDCTAYTEDDVYYAGALTGGKDASAGGGAVFVRRSNTLKLYDGRITGNTSSIAGGGIALQANGNGHTGGKLYMFGGEISNNTAINGTTYKTGGGLYMGGTCLFEMTGGTISGNKGSGGGAIYTVGADITITTKDATITGNTASYTGAAIHCGGATTVTLEDTTITGNTCTNTSAGGTIRMDAAGGKVILSGKTVVAGNSLAPKIGDIMLMNTSTNKLNVNGLTGGSNVRFCAPNTTVTAAGDVITAGSAQTDWDSSWVTFVEKSGTEQHIAYNGSAFSFAAGHFHGETEFLAWTKTDSLPASGAYYLTSDVSVSKQVTVSGELKLCLNGHKVTGYKGRAFDVTGTLALCSCAAGATFSGFGNNAHGGVIQSSGTVYAENLTFTGNDAGTGYGGVLLSTKGDVTFKDCVFTDNRATQGSAVSVAGASAIIGCTFTDNTASASGTLRAVGSQPILVENCTFTGNTAKAASAIQTNSSSLLTLKDVTITGNSCTTGYGAVNATGSIQPVVLQGKVVITGNVCGDKPQNLHLQNGTTDGYDVSGLTAGSSIGVSLETARITAGSMHFTTANENNNPSFFVSDDNTYEVALDKAGKLILQIPLPPITHIHCICGKTANTHCDHAAVDFTDWTHADSLPSEGTWCLTTDVSVTKQTAITGELTLCLNGHSIKTTTRVFHCSTGAKLTITDCAKTPGTISGATNSAILFATNSQDTALSLWNGVFADNHLLGGGAAVVVQGQTVFNMYGGTFTGNWAESAMKVNSDGTPVLDASGNPTCYSSNGGALFAGPGTTFNFYGGTFTGNKATHVEYYKKDATSVTKSGGNGGAMAIYGTANLYGGIVCDNDAFLGGGVFVSGSQGMLNLLGTEISGNRGYSAGGVLSMSKATVNLKSGKITGNTANLSGGGIYMSVNTKLFVTGGEITENQSASSGAGIFLQTAQAELTGCKLTGNISKNLGGAIYLAEKSQLILNSGTITGNQAVSGAGVFATKESAFTMNGGNIDGNNSTSSGGGVSIFESSTFAMKGGSISKNTSTSDGGGLYLLRSTVNFGAGTISDNTGANGGGIKITGGKITFSGTTITGNLARGKMATSSTTGQPVKVEGSGGGFHASHAGYKVNGVQLYDVPAITVHSFYLANNKATSAGGGAVVQSKGTQFTMYAGTISGNEATSGGGGIYFSTDTTNKILSGTISGNSSLKAGGVFILNCTADLANVTVANNKAGSIGGGFVIMGKTTQVNMKGMQIQSNASEGTGGVAVVQNYANLNMEDSVLSGNSAKTTGGVYFSNPTSGSFRNVQIKENTSDTAGGAIYVSKNTPVLLENCTLQANRSNSSGGAVYTKGRTELIGCKVLDNVSGKNGGAIGSGQSAGAFLSDNAGIRATDTIFSGNQAAEQGGAVYNHRGCPTILTGCTFTDNAATGEGSAIYADGRFGLTDASITGNASTNDGAALYITGSNYDGHSYTSGYKYLAGKLQILDNQGGDLYLCENAFVALTGESLAQGSHLEVRLQAGVLTSQLLGVYDYEGGELVYTVTPGNRSITDPEHYAEPTAPAEADQTGNTVLYVTIGVIALLAAGAIALIVIKKKKAGKATNV